MKKKEWNEGLNHLDPDLVEKYVEQKEKFTHKKKTKAVWIRFGAIAACFALIVGAIAIVPMLREDGSGSIQPPNVPTWDGAKYSAQDIAAMFDMTYLKDSVPTNAYTKIYVPDAKYLYIDKIMEEEHFGVYQYNGKENTLNQDEFQNFIDMFLPELAVSINATTPQYEIKEKSSYEDRLQVNIDIGSYSIWIQQNETRDSFGLYKGSGGNRQIVLDGETVQIDQRLSDEEIITSIQSIKNKLFGIFNVSFPDTKIIRNFGSYSEHGAESIYIYFYDESAHPLNSTQARPISDYICIGFDNISNYSGDIVSDSILTVANINYIKGRNDIAEEYALIANAKGISLEDAEALLYNGYVFGGHSCPLCMAAQDKVSFEGYDFVDIEYMFGYDSQTGKATFGIPFYAFYKNIGTSENGNTIYAKTYVAAIEIRGYDEYFENQKGNHRNADDYDVID